MSENLKNNGVQQYLQEYEKLVNKGVRRNFSKETADTMFDLKDAEISALRFKRKEDLDELKRLIKYAENPKYSEDVLSHEFLSDGEMLDYVLDKLKELTRVKNRLNN